MKPIAAPLSLLLLLTACARTEPVTDDDLETMEETPAPALPNAEVDDPAMTPTEGMEWSAEGDAVRLGPAGEAPALEFACAEGDQGIVLTRYGVEGDGTAGTLTIVGNGTTSRVPVVADGAPEGGMFDWTATLTRGELASSIRTAFVADEPVNITATGVSPIVVLPNADIRGLLDRCVGASGERAAGPTDERSDVETLRDGVAESNQPND